MSKHSTTSGPHGELDDIQGLLRFGFKHHTEAVFLLLRVKDAAAARKWLGQVQVTSAVSLDPPPGTVLQVALTRAGMDALGVGADLVGGFSEEFVEGMSGDANRSRRLGDVGANAPERWDWGNGDLEPHVAVLMYALPGSLAAFQRTTEARCADGFDVVDRLVTTNMGGVEPFGFVDGLSQPQIDWNRELPAADAKQLSYRNLGCLGEFILGYPNEYGLYTPRPLLDASRDPCSCLPRAEESPDSADLGRNGTYLVIRQLRQDVRGFWRAMDQSAGGIADERERLASQLVGRTLSGVPIVLGGRAAAGSAAPATAGYGGTAAAGSAATGSGAPAAAGAAASADLSFAGSVASGSGASATAGAAASAGLSFAGSAASGSGAPATPGASGLAHPGTSADASRSNAPDLNAFTFESDPAGHLCPIGAHIRRANPRTADLPPGGTGLISQLIRTLGLASKARAQDLAASTRFHRLLRRGREYGARMSPEQALAPPTSGASPMNGIPSASGATPTPMPAESGLHFICLNANIQRQFEFVQSAWIMSTQFNGLHEESDPLLGQRLPGTAGRRCDYFTMPRADGPARRLEKLPQFVTVAGGAYFFLPGIRALRFLASSAAR